LLQHGERRIGVERRILYVYRDISPSLSSGELKNGRRNGGGRGRGAQFLS
jgi:hypothetical protein